MLIQRLLLLVALASATEHDTIVKTLSFPSRQAAANEVRIQLLERQVELLKAQLRAAGFDDKDSQLGDLFWSDFCIVILTRTQLCLCSLTGHADGIGASPITIYRDDKPLALQESQSATLDLEGTNVKKKRKDPPLTTGRMLPDVTYAMVVKPTGYTQRWCASLAEKTRKRRVNDHNVLGTQSKSKGCYNKNQDVTTNCRRRCCACTCVQDMPSHSN